MRHGKKLLSVILAMVMTLAMTVSVAAAEVPPTQGNTLTINAKKEGHEYQAYQVFEGRISDGLLVDIKWGDGVKGADLLADLKADPYFATELAEATDAAGVAKALDGKENDSEFANNFATAVSKHLSTTHRDGTSGKDKVCTISGLPDGYYFVKDGTVAQGDTYTKFILWVTENQSVEAKTDVPSAEKKVKENVKGVTGNEKYGEGYNDVADYNMGDTVPFAFYSRVPDMSSFTTYKYVFHDELSAGLTFNDDVSVKIGGVAISEGYTVTPTEKGFDVEFLNLKTVTGATEGAEIRIDFTATLNQSAVVGLPGNPNTMYLEYSNNPNDTEDTTTGTPDTVIVFTYELDVTKVDGNEPTKKLVGVQFKLKNSDGAYAVVDENGKVTGWTAEGSVLETNAESKFMVIGLDDGTYTLEETAPLDGYNSIQPITIKISATTSNGQNWTTGVAAQALTALTIKINSDDATPSSDANLGKVETTVINEKGIELPGTGGIGTTIFYVIGGILVLGAAILLVAKKRTRM